MKLKFTLLTLIFSYALFSQINFEKGYIIDKNNNKTECFIKNNDWLENPVEFEYKLNPTAEIIIGNLSSIKEFSIENEFKYLNVEVKIDKFNNEPKNVEYNKRNPVYINEKVFLKVLIDDNYKLYKYKENNHTSFFIQDGGQFQQLIYKKYLDDIGQLVTNNLYKQQLSTYLSKEKLDLFTFERLNYSQYDLEKLLKKVGSKSIISDEARKVKYKNSFRIYLQPGLNSVSPSISGHDSFGTYNFKANSKIVFRPAIEFEYNLPFNKNKWSIFLNLNTINYSFKGVGKYSAGSFRRDVLTDMTYKSTDIGLGVKHYLFLNNKSSIFIGAAYNLSTLTKGKITFSSNFQDFNATDENYLSFGVGYNYKNYIGVEAKLNYQKPYAPSYYLDAYVNAISVTLNYNILHKK
ncbi:hypothetical protein QWY90_07625 [Flavobacterium paronense]|uniref:Outer membrane protein beta-barrel domain-containing protein n=1 Tax=Flavobacterium paronense TaxID=1392775 RepID=A0ABV5GGN6_9FLAO|nr:hypothetical protein [Flavobacterium paronense]MDN3677181.1 hypothetical protein [Flavobacterium paronense]